MYPIKFRAWTGKRMFYQENQYFNSFIRRAVHFIIADSGNIESEKEHESYLPNGGNIEEYLTQFTGLHDKNGKEIYEGDIVKYNYFSRLVNFGEGIWEDNHIGEIIWDKEKAFYCIKGWKEPMTNCQFGGTGGMKIIGNIYENIDMLK